MPNLPMCWTTSANPAAITISRIANHANGDFAMWLRDRKNSRRIPHRLENCGYVSVRSESKDGLWIVDHKRQAIYAKTSLTIRDRVGAARELARW